MRWWPCNTRKISYSWARRRKPLIAHRSVLKQFLITLPYGQFHPQDWSPKALLKVVLDKMLEAPPSTEKYIRLFEKFISENAGRAQKNGIPLTYIEIVSLWNTFIAPSPITSVAMERVMYAKFKQLMNNNTSTPKHNNPPANGSPNK